MSVTTKYPLILFLHGVKKRRIMLQGRLSFFQL
jgi:predicted peptidase